MGINLRDTGRVYYTLKYLIIFIIIILFLNTTDKIYASAQWDKILIEISLGLLAFIGIFYAFVIRREVTEKRESMLVNKWKGYSSEFKRDLKNLQKESDNKKPEYQTMLGISQSIQEKLNDMTLFETEIDIRKQLLRGAFAFLITILAFFIDTVNSWSFIPPNTFFPVKTITYGIFWYGIYKTIELLLTWDRITRS